MPKLRASVQIVNNHMIEGYMLECPDRSGFLYAVLSQGQKTLLVMLDYKGTQHTLFEKAYIGLADTVSIDKVFRGILIDATQVAMTLMYE